MPAAEESATSVPYEVLKRIKGRDYVYRVESVADAGTGRLRRRWTYLGRYDGATIRYARRRIAGEARLRFTRAIVDLLETRDVDFLTVDVIARAANSSRATFYRQFADRDCALAAAFEHLTTTVYAALPGLESRRRGGERAALRAWLDALVGALVDRRVPTRRVLAAPGAGTWRGAATERWRDRLAVTLEPYLVRLREAGVVRCDDPALVASGIVCLIEGLVARTIGGDCESVDRVALVDVASIAERLVFGP